MDYIDDPHSPSFLQDFSDNTFLKTFDRSPNPFHLPDESQILGFKEFERNKISIRRKEIRSMSLIQRADIQKPAIPPCLLNKSVLATKHHPISQSALSTSKVLRDKRENEHQKSMRISDFIQNKREIYILQLLIDKKKEEIQKIYNRMDQAEKDLIKRDEDIDISSEEVKLKNTESEANLARAKHKMEEKARRKVELQRELKQVTLNVNMINSEIYKNEEQLESFREYNDFLQKLTPEGENTLDHFNDPSVLLNEFEEIKEFNLLLIQDCQYYEQIYNRGIKNVNKKKEITDGYIQSVQDQIDSLEVVTPSTNENDTELNQKDFDIKNDEYIRLAKLIERTYINCFGQTADVPPVGMLERIENQLEDFYKRIDLVDPHFAHSRQALKDKQRRDKLRREKQERQAAEQRLKMEQAIERANKPIKKKSGRPLMERTTIKKNEKKTDYKLLREMKEKQRFDGLLYGNAFEEY